MTSPSQQSAALYQQKDVQHLIQLSHAASDLPVISAIASYLALLNQDEHAHALFSQGLEQFPNNPVMQNGVAYTILKLNRSEQFTRALDLAQSAYLTAPDNAAYRDTLNQLNKLMTNAEEQT